MKMKHAAALSMAALMGLSLVGCGGSSAGTETTAAADSKQQRQKQQIMQVPQMENR